MQSTYRQRHVCRCLHLVFAAADYGGYSQVMALRFSGETLAVAISTVGVSAGGHGK